MAKNSGGTKNSVNSGASNNSETYIRSVIQSAGWEDMGGGSWQLDVADKGIGGGFILEDTDPVNKLEYGKETVYEVQDVWDKDYNMIATNRKGFDTLAQAKKFVLEELVKNSKK